MKSRQPLTSPAVIKLGLVFLTSVATALSMHTFFSNKKTLKQLDMTIAEADRQTAIAKENLRRSAELDKKVLKTIQEADRVLEEARVSRISRGFRRN